MNTPVFSEVFWLRFSKALLAVILGLWALMVAYGNVADYDTNWVYVQEVMSMASTKDDPEVSWRAATDPAIQRLAYAAITTGEAVAGAMFAIAGILMLLRINGPNPQFRAAKTPFAVGLIASILVWLFGFMVVAGEWFQMWRSLTFNAQQTAFIFYATMLLSGIYVFQDNDGPVESKRRHTLR
ncbi:DUF2165 domain-containing protein [Ruegeria sp. 2205SS24-7]|uniref:DUF2165 family protein n=1 Tax=Ruegeria discodermiae TaxID=3064389 RepID=UPI00274158F9|nr:DUF2165 domain-containing protein [Ruegeria sp. 2205SS24-7]MDP5219930.1 DUF2165 domain-containing protein [Ruegeria sp. 2205SS24-7]